MCTAAPSESLFTASDERDRRRNEAIGLVLWLVLALWIEDSEKRGNCLQNGGCNLMSVSNNLERFFLQRA